MNDKKLLEEAYAEILTEGAPPPLDKIMTLDPQASSVGFSGISNFRVLKDAHNGCMVELQASRPDGKIVVIFSTDTHFD